MRTIVLSAEDIVKIVEHVGLDNLMDEVIQGLTNVCRDSESERYRVPIRDGFEYQSPTEGLLEWMPVMKNGGSATFKLVGYHPNNPRSLGLPTILSSAMVFDTETGHLMGLADATFPTAVRTGAASAVASQVLAVENAAILGLVGAGTQAVTQLHALSRVFAFDRVLVYDVDPEVSRSFQDRAASLNLGNIAINTASLKDVVSSADILCTATSVAIGGGPVFNDSGLKPWIHINAVGSDFPGKTELPRSVLERSMVCPDFMEQARKEGECQQITPELIGPSLVDLIKHSRDYADRRSKPTVFDSTGWALEDHVAMEILFRYAKELGQGSRITIESVSDDPRNPYGFISEVREKRKQKKSAATRKPELVSQ